jgi:hypothetical protein
MYTQSGFLGLQTPLHRKLYVDRCFSLHLNLIPGQGELAHRALKAFYPLISKLDTPAQLAKHERRRRVLRRVAGCDLHSTEQPLADSPIGLNDHHYIPTLCRNNPLDLFGFLRDHDNDPAVAVGGALLMFTFNILILCRHLYLNSRTTYYIVFKT